MAEYQCVWRLHSWSKLCRVLNTRTPGLIASAVQARVIADINRRIVPQTTLLSPDPHDVRYDEVCLHLPLDVYPAVHASIRRLKND